jgi:hypothetical protein
MNENLMKKLVFAVLLVGIVGGLSLPGVAAATPTACASWDPFCSHSSNPNPPNYGQGSQNGQGYHYHYQNPSYPSNSYHPSNNNQYHPSYSKPYPSYPTYPTYPSYPSYPSYSQPCVNYACSYPSYPTYPSTPEQVEQISDSGLVYSNGVQLILQDQNGCSIVLEGMPNGYISDQVTVYGLATYNGSQCPYTLQVTSIVPEYPQVQQQQVVVQSTPTTETQVTTTTVTQTPTTTTAQTPVYETGTTDYTPIEIGVFVLVAIAMIGYIVYRIRNPQSSTTSSWQPTPVAVAPRQPTAFCTNCGHPLDKQTKFCGTCGAPAT